MIEGDNDGLHFQELEVLDEKRLQAQQRIELCQARITKAINKKVKERVFQKRNLVLAVRRSMVMTYKTKEKSNLSGKDLSGRDSLLERIIPPSKSNSDMLMMLINDKCLKSIIHDHINIKLLVIKTDLSHYFFSKEALSSSGINVISNPSGTLIDIKLL